MRRNRLALYVHFVWTTWDRLPLIEPAMERRLYRNIGDSAKSLGCQILAINGVADHVHILLSLPSTIAIAALAKKMKGTSSRFVNDQLQPSTLFKWQGFYGAFSVSRWDLPKIVSYINNQKEHHAQDTLWPELEDTVDQADDASGVFAD